MSGQYDGTKDFFNRNEKGRDWAGVAIFIAGRLVDPFLQYAILANGLANPLVEKLGGTVLPAGPPLLTNTFIDRVGLSPYRAILLGMSIGSMLKSNFHLAVIMQEKITPAKSVMAGAGNTVFNSLNTIFFICSQTSASVNGEPFPQTPFIAGLTLYTVGLFLEWYSEWQRHVFKQKPESKGKVYTGGLFGLSRHINYFGYTMWRTGYAIAGGGWALGAVQAALFTYQFTQDAIPNLQQYLEERVSMRHAVLASICVLADYDCSTASSTRRTRRRCRTSSRPSCSKPCEERQLSCTTVLQHIYCLYNVYSTIYLLPSAANESFVMKTRHRRNSRFTVVRNGHLLFATLSRANSHFPTSPMVTIRRLAPHHKRSCFALEVQFLFSPPTCSRSSFRGYRNTHSKLRASFRPRPTLYLPHTPEHSTKPRQPI